MSSAKRITRKQSCINGLEHDIKYYEEELAKV